MTAPMTTPVITTTPTEISVRLVTIIAIWPIVRLIAMVTIRPIVRLVAIIIIRSISVVSYGAAVSIGISDAT
jgi:hypothetical protein